MDLQDIVKSSCCWLLRSRACSSLINAEFRQVLCSSPPPPNHLPFPALLLYAPFISLFAETRVYHSPFHHTSRLPFFCFCFSHLHVKRSPRCWPAAPLRCLLTDCGPISLTSCLLHNIPFPDYRFIHTVFDAHPEHVCHKSLYLINYLTFSLVSIAALNRLLPSLLWLSLPMPLWLRRSTRRFQPLRWKERMPRNYYGRDCYIPPILQYDFLRHSIHLYGIVWWRISTTTE